MMENRSFDHYFGWYPGADGLLDNSGDIASRSVLDLNGDAVPLSYWGAGEGGLNRFTADGRPGGVDPSHGWTGGRTTFNGGRMDGFLQEEDNANDPYVMSYYLADDIPVLASMAREFTVHDRYFPSLLASTFPNREYLHSATSGGVTNNDFPGMDSAADASDDDATIETPSNVVQGFPWLTIWDRLEAAGVDWGYYFNDLPVIALWGDRFLLGSLANKVKPIEQFYADAAAGTLPNVYFLDPDFVNDQNGNDDHPFADIRAGQAFIGDTYHAVRTGPQWPSSAFFVTYDEWGGFYDHVAPPRVRDDRGNRSDIDTDFGQLGFRVPTVTCSPWSPKGQISSRTYDHTSILKFIEYRFGLAPLTMRDASAANIGEVLDVSDPDRPPNPGGGEAVPKPDPPCLALPGEPPDSDDPSGPGNGLSRAYDPPYLYEPVCDRAPAGPGGGGAGATGATGATPAGGVGVRNPAATVDAAPAARDVTTHRLYRLAEARDLGRFDRRGHDPRDSFS
ncbi:alkaline phosphatase family protein [soil metagenome]